MRLKRSFNGFLVSYGENGIEDAVRKIMKKNETHDATLLQIIAMLETALADYAVRYGLTKKARKALQNSEEFMRGQP